MTMKDFIDIAAFSEQELLGLLHRAAADKKLFQAGRLPASCPLKILALIFEKQSLRTRVSFEAGIVQLGGYAIALTNADIGLGTREPVADVARVLGRMCDAVAARTYSHQTITELAKFCPKPVINALSDYSHPCQAMADMMTARELLGEMRGRKWAFVGDGNNVARSLAMLCAKLGVEFVLACPKGYELDQAFVAALPMAAKFSMLHDAQAAVAGAAVVYTDTWTSMGQEDQKGSRQKAFQPFQVHEKLVQAAPKEAIVLHCLPAYRGSEITDAVMEAHAESIFTEAENRLHFQRSLLNVLIAEGGIK